MLRRLSLRARLAAAFAAALLLVLALAGFFVYLRVSASLTETIDDGLHTRAADLERQLAGSGRRRSEAAQDAGRCRGQLRPGPLPRRAGARLDAAPGAGAALDPATLAEARRQPTFVGEREVPGIDGEGRLVAEPVDAAGEPVVLIVGASTGDREEALSGIVAAFGVGAPLAVLLASGLGYLLAARSLAPVETMRRRAEVITLEHSGERLPLSPARDEIHRLGETLNAMLDRIEGSLERERVFVADASHELRTPLAVLRAELELAQRPGRSADELRAAVGSAVVEVDRLSRLAEDLLVIARSEGGRLPIKRESVELRGLVERVRERFAEDAEASGRAIAAEAPPGLRAAVDPLRIEQALGNLIGNALEHGSGDIRVRALAEGDTLVLEVSDRGSGIPESFGEVAFERFSRADPGRTGGGAGLGLAIVKTVAEAHGGEASIGTGDRGGAAVLMRLPLRG